MSNPDTHFLVIAHVVPSLKTGKQLPDFMEGHYPSNRLLTSYSAFVSGNSTRKNFASMSSGRSK
jgi:hypothetical protein